MGKILNLLSKTKTLKLILKEFLQQWVAEGILPKTKPN